MNTGAIVPFFAMWCISCLAVEVKPEWKRTRFASVSNNILEVTVPKGREKEGGAAHATIDLTPFQNKVLQGMIKCKGENISVPTENWNGLKFMLHYRDESTGEEFWPNTASLTGSFPEQTIYFHADFLGKKPTKGELTLGLQSSSGRVVFDLSTLKLETTEGIFPRTNLNYRVSYSERVRKTPALRGVMLPGGPCTENDFQTLKEWGATLARYQMIRNWAKTNTDQDLEDFDRWLNSKLDHLERVLLWARRYGLKIVVDLHVPPGGRNAAHEMNMFFDARFADHFVLCWKRIATRFKGHPEIFGYDLINEPHQKRPAPHDYWNLQRRAAEAIRAIDPDTPIILESNDWDSPYTYRYLSPLAMDNVIYQVHMYVPLEFTHQGVLSKENGKDNRLTYPDETRRGGAWNKEYLRKVLSSVRDFQKKHHARIYVGEFSAITWAPGADRYLADCISLFEEYGWDWTYHAFREWNGWSVEHAGDAHNNLKPSADNPRKRVLLDGLKSGQSCRKKTW